MPLSGMGLLIFILIFWALPLALFCYLAEKEGKSVMTVFVMTLIFGWLGGILSYFLCTGESIEDKIAKEDAELERRREEAMLKALGKHPEQKNSPMSAAKKEKLERLLGGKR